MIEVFVSAQVAVYRSHLHPDRRRTVKKALANLARGRGDICPLEGELEGYHRLRVGKYRIVFRYGESGEIRCLFMETRPLVYDLLQANPDWLLE